MSAADTAERPHEIIIVRHGGHGDHDDHHGGAWKIAFADFMTAMMCFFLVMWLINATNEETKVAVASYFNPIKLVDRNASRKGLDDVGEGPNSPDDGRKKVVEPAEETPGAGTTLTGPAVRGDASDAGEDVKHTDSHLFSDPYSVLAEIASETGKLQNISAKGDGGAQSAGPSSGASGGEAFRDPFAPDFWSQQIVPAIQSEETRIEPAEVEPAPETVTPPPPADPLESSVAESSEAEMKAQPLEAVPAPPPPAAPPAEVVPSETEQAAAEIRKELRDAFKADERLYEGMSVEATPDGISIAITDLLDFGMFEIGSAVPRRDLVLAMEKIAKILDARTGKVIINGHTDGRPFSSATYDNWRLSTARAHSAYYMLVRAGLDEKRISEVAGFADRKLKVPADPLASSNRRIEILLEIGG